MKKFLVSRWIGIGLSLMVLLLSACGGLRYVQRVPEAENFHPQSIGVLPVALGPYAEAEGSIEDIIGTVLAEKKFFARIVNAGDIKEQMRQDSELGTAIVDYLTKLDKVNFSDPNLSQLIGQRFGIDAFLVSSVDFWAYTVEGEDKIAKAAVSIDLVEAATGKIMWKARHHEVEDYWLLKPNIAKVARKVVGKMIGAMPH